jgi:hypothetical protein
MPFVILSEAGAHAGVPNTRGFRVVGWSHATAQSKDPGAAICNNAMSGSSTETSLCERLAAV